MFLYSTFPLTIIPLPHYVSPMETHPNSTPILPPPPPSADFLANPEFKAMVRNELSDILADFIATQEKRASEVSLIERIVRVEEAQRSHEQLTRALLEQMNLRFEEMQRNMDKRFVEMQQSMDKRFESMDNRFAEMQQSMDKRFESMDKRFAEMQQSMDKRFDAVDKRFESMDKRFVEMQRNMDKRFEAVDKRFESMDKRFESMDKRFESMDKRFDDLGRRMDRFMFWSLGLTVSATFLIITVLR